MSETIFLLDSPTRASLRSQSNILRATLKDFERSFAVGNDGRKPSKDDIKADATVAAQYKQYNRVRDVLSGKLSYETFLAPPGSPSAKRSHRRTDSAVSWTPRKPRYDATPRKTSHTFGADLYDSPSSTTPKLVFLSAIGPTPQRDGTVMGLFDLLTNSAKSSQATPSASRKRKLEQVDELTARESKSTDIARTPRPKRKNSTDDLLQHLIGTPETGRRKHSRTPASDGRKFMLSHFFATPSTVRYSQFDTGADVDADDALKTPLRNRVLGLSPEDKQPLEVAPDATPAYLRRSTSFKDRLMSAADIKSGARKSASFMPLTESRYGPPTLQHFKSAPKPLSQIVANLRSLEDGEHDDDLEALYEIEHSGHDTLVGDNQVGSSERGDEARSDENAGQPTRIWKKRGQKRTTRRSKMRPTAGPIADAPKFVAADDDDDDNVDSNESGQAEEEQSDVAETQLADVSKHTSHALEHYHSDEESDFEGQLSVTGYDSDTIPSKKQKPQAASGSKQAAKQKVATGRKPGTYNPNAQSHMNFRSLKIRNKNSKARGAGRSRFGKRR